jgi:chaperone modulatory protein CbpM
MDPQLILIAEFESASGLTRAEIVELVEHGVFSPAGAAARLREAFELPPAGLALALAYRERMLELERRLRELECRLPR